MEHDRSSPKLGWHKLGIHEVIPQVGLLDTPHLHRTPMGFMFLPLGTFNLQVLW